MNLAVYGGNKNLQILARVCHNETNVNTQQTV
jgi:hypothetical protein